MIMKNSRGYERVCTGSDYSAVRNEIAALSYQPAADEIATLSYYTARNEIPACLPASPACFAQV